MRRLLLLLAFVVFGRCIGADAPPPPPASPPPPYDFAAPDAIFELPNRLQEISGLTALDGATLGAVQDEDGDLFVLSAATGEVLRRHDFGGDGDYEGVERVGEAVWVLRSDGRLYEATAWAEEKAGAGRHRAALHVSCDAEGFGYDEAGQRLLIACKEGAGRGYGGHRAIYAFGLRERSLQRRPAYLIPLDSVAVRMGQSGFDAQLRRLARPVADVSGFKPSALAVHPRTGRLWVLSSVQKAVVVLDRNGGIFAAWPLPERLNPQPEGLAFLPDGTLFIANEGSGRRGTLLRFAYQPRL
ncbi:MAG: hypothetical protein R3362_00135 [Rhodothermales bacterium]|nr:hypothetical protein [Rhodothermales bacterium]